MSNKNAATSFIIGLTAGVALGAVIGLIYAPESGEDARKLLRGKAEVIVNPFKKLMFNLGWMIMSPREKYEYLWTHGGSLHDWREEYKPSLPGEANQD